MALRVIEHRQLLYIVAMFMIVQFLGLLLASQIFSGATYVQLSGAQIASGYFGTLFYIGYIIVVSVILLLIFKFYKGDALFKVLEFVVVVVSSFVFFLALYSAILGNAYSAFFGNTGTYLAAGAALSAICLMVLKLLRPHLRNITAMVSSVGVGLVLGISFGFYMALLFMFVLAIYDFVSVFITKHMISLGNMAIKNNMSLMIMASEIEAVPKSSLSQEEQKEYLAQKGGGKEIYEALKKNNLVPISARTALGTGDLATPLMLAVSAYKVELNFILSFVITIGSVLGILLTMYTLKRYKRPLPAIPFLLFGILISLGIYYLYLAL